MIYRSVSTFLLALTGLAAAHADIVYSDDFSSSLAGGAANSSDYTLTAPGVYSLPPVYRVISNPATAFTNGYPTFYDHTQGTAAGAMLFFDGAANSSTRIYYHALGLTAGTPYSISYWGASGGATALPSLGLAVNGTTIGTTLGTVLDQWQQSTAVFTPTTTGTYTFSVFDFETAGSGNDGAIDDFLVTSPTATPEPATLAALGLGTLAFLKRRKRA